MLIEVDGERVGGVWNGRYLNIDVPAGRHTFRAFMGWIGSKPLEVDVHEGTMTAIGVRASWEEAAAANGLYAPIGPMAQGVGRYTQGRPDTGLQISEHLEPEPMTIEQKRTAVSAGVTLAVLAVSIGVGPLITHAAGARGELVFMSGIAGPIAVYVIGMTAYAVVSCVISVREARRNRK